MRRVMVIGQPGSGKSTFAHALGEATGLPVHHMDLIHWLPGWVERPMAEKLPLVRAIEDAEAWILEGGLSRTYGSRAARADTIVHLDVALPTRAWRVLWRRWTYRGGATRPDLPPDCPERLDPEFLRFIWRTRHSSRDRMLEVMAGAPHARTVTLRTIAEADAFVREARRGTEGRREGRCE